MRQLIRYICMPAAAALFLFPSCNTVKPEPGPGPEPQPEVPVPPTEVNEANVYKICIFSTLSDEALFETHASSVITDFMLGATGKKPVLYLVERADYQIGKKLDYLIIILDSRYNGFFAPQQRSGGSVKGTAMFTIYNPSEYDGIACDELHISGCRFGVPLNASTSIANYTARFDSASQFEKLAAQRRSVLTTDGVLVASVAMDIKESISKLASDRLPGCRLCFADSSAKGAYDVMVLVPSKFVVRGIEEGEKANIPYMIISIEKFK